MRREDSDIRVRSGGRAGLALSIAAVVAMCVFIFYMSAQPASASDGMSLGVGAIVGHYIVPGFDKLDAAEQLAFAESINHPVRKFAHFGEYALLGILVLNLADRLARVRGMRRPQGLRDSRASVAIGAWVVSVLYAATDELHQVFVPGRACMFTDVCIDSAGVATGIAVALCAGALVGRLSRCGARRGPGRHGARCGGRRVHFACAEAAGETVPSGPAVHGPAVHGPGRRERKAPWLLR